MPQHVTAILRCPLRVNAGSPPCGLPAVTRSALPRIGLLALI
jgi:hypothetical protein